ncbi:MAG: COX15/CtaA family protein [Alphaproteobacteria bacterium]
MVLLMVLVGGITRLTESGLSMVTWNPVTGWVPPVSHQAWEDAFLAYKATPEYQQINRGMSLSDFQGIYWWEFIHRVLGRLTGLLVALPVLFLGIRRLVSPSHFKRLLVLPVLVAFQGYMGWYMVQSGLVDRTDVSPYRLMMHFSLALILLALIVREWTTLRGYQGSSQNGGLLQRGNILLLLYVPTVLLGALVAGLNGGMVYNTFPLMNGHWIPPEVMAAPFFFDDPAAVQWLHRVLAFGFFTFVVVDGMRQRQWGLLSLVALQITLGAITVLGQVPLWAASWHQVNAALILVLLMLRRYGPPEATA